MELRASGSREGEEAVKRAVAALVLALGLAAGAHAAHQVAQVEDVIAFLETREVGCAGSQAQEVRYWEVRWGSSVEVLGTIKRDPNDVLARLLAAPGKHAVYRVTIGLPPPRGSVDLVPLVEWARRKIRATKRPSPSTDGAALDVGVSQ